MICPNCGNISFIDDFSDQIHGHHQHLPHDTSHNHLHSSHEGTNWVMWVTLAGIVIMGIVGIANYMSGSSTPTYSHFCSKCGYKW